MKKHVLALFLSFVLFSLAIVNFTCSKKNEDPTCKITSPVNGSVHYAYSDIDFTVEATDSDGTITEVRYYINDEGVSSKTEFPYSFTFDPSETDQGIVKVEAISYDNDGGNKSDMIHIGVTSNPNITLNANPSQGASPLVVDFSYTCYYEPSNVTWDFGDGSTSTDHQPTHTYQTEGVYDVRLILTSELGVDTITEEELINVSGEASGAFLILKNYLIDQNYDLPALLDGWVVAPSPKADGGIVDVDNDCTIPDYHVFDIRSSSDFTQGHIKGAINVPLVDILTKAADYNDKPILVVCYTGQTSPRGVLALKMSGYSAKVMKFGMSQWNEVFDKWSAHVGNSGFDNPYWVKADAPQLPIYEYPIIETSIWEPEDILAENILSMLAASGWGIKSTEILQNPSAYNTYNFWSLDSEYLALGHFAGAYQYKPIRLANVNNLPVNDDAYIYCFTGQTSSFIVAWLQVLGYENAKSAHYGANSIIYDALDAYNPKVAWHHSYDYSYAVGK